MPWNLDVFEQWIVCVCGRTIISDTEDNSKAICLVTCNLWSGIQILDTIIEVTVQVSMLPSY